MVGSKHLGGTAVEALVTVSRSMGVNQLVGKNSEGSEAGGT